MTAAPGNGARGTLVELIPRQLTAAGDDRTPITGRRTQYVHITNHTGRKNIPLHLWFDGGNTVLNDGSPQLLNLCIGNGSDKTEIKLTENSRFSLSFDVGADEDAGWTLTTLANAEAIKVSFAKPVAPGANSNLANAEAIKVSFVEMDVPSRVGDPDPNAQKNTVRHWDVKPGKQELGKRGGDGHLNVSITNIVVHKNKIGHANLYVEYTGIPGYQDGQFILTVEKSPLVFTASGGVKIGGVDVLISPECLFSFASGGVKIGGVDVGQSLITLANEIKAIHENIQLERDFNVTVLPNKFGKLTFTAGKEPRGLLFGNKATFTGTFGLTGSNPYDIATRSETVHSTNPWLRLDGSLPYDLSIFDAAKKKLRHELQAELERQYNKLRSEFRETAWLRLNFRPKEVQRGNFVLSDPIPSQSLAGFYFYDIGRSDSRRMQLNEDGTVGIGKGGMEERWTSSTTDSGKRQISLSFGYDNTMGIQTLCTCEEDLEGIFRGVWNNVSYAGRAADGLSVALIPEKYKKVAMDCDLTIDAHGNLSLTFDEILFRRIFALRYDALPDPNITQIASIMYDHNPVPTWSLSYDNGCIGPLLPEPYSIAIDLSQLTFDIR